MAGSIPGRLRRLAHTVRARLNRGAGETGGDFGPERDLAFAVLEEEGEGAFQRVGASLVGAWEVGIADLARAMEPRLDADAKNRLIERLSDALVPTQQPLQDAKSAFSQAVKTGTQQGLQSGRLSDAYGPAVAVLQDLGAQLAAGWARTNHYLASLWEVLPQGAQVQIQYGDLGQRLQALFDHEADRFAQAMTELPRQRSLEVSLRDAMDTWYAKVSVGVEILIYDGRTLMVDAANRLPLR